MVIQPIKGKRREVRRMLAQQSKVLLDVYWTGIIIDPETCPLQKVLSLKERNAS